MDADFFGLTNDVARYDLARAYTQAAAADGWAVTPTYGDSEPFTRAATLTRDGFKLITLARDNGADGGRFRYQASVHIYGPDELIVKPPDAYDWAEIQRRVLMCNLCDRFVDTVARYSFAGRCCQACLPSARAEFERPGWTN